MGQVLAALAACVITTLFDDRLNGAEINKERKSIAALTNILIQHLAIVFTTALIIFYKIFVKKNNDIFENSLKQILLQFLITIVIGLSYSFLKKILIKNSEKEWLSTKQNKTVLRFSIFTVLNYAFSFFIILSSSLFIFKYGLNIIRTIYYYFFANFKNNGTEFYIHLVMYILLPLILLLAISIKLYFSKRNFIVRKKNPNSKLMGKHLRIIMFIISVFLVIYSVFSFVILYNTSDTFYQLFLKSDFVSDNYVTPDSSTIKFPEQKRNLILIELESMENSYLSKDLGGNIDVNLMPELTELAYEGYVFSDNENKFGGPQEVVGTNWSIASIVNQTTGIPMIMPDSGNIYGYENHFLPNTTTLMDILTEQGYEQTVMFGADGNYGNFKYYFLNHGNTTVFDLGYARRNGLVPEDYKVWWGFEDDKLYEFAKDELTRMYKTGKPFGIIMETADTHKPGGYLSENAPTPYESHYANAIAYSSSQVVEFVRWIQEQPFYENTTIVLIGDHLSMDTVFFEEYGFTDDYDRSTFNLILNPAPNVDVSNEQIFHNRMWSNVDMFPTILASMGVEIKGECLGIGTNLFSGEPTIIDEYGLKYVNNEIRKHNSYYDNE